MMFVFNNISLMFILIPLVIGVSLTNSYFVALNSLLRQFTPKGSMMEREHMAFPKELMILSAVMLTMWFVNVYFGHGLIFSSLILALLIRGLYQSFSLLLLSPSPSLPQSISSKSSFSKMKRRSNGTLLAASGLMNTLPSIHLSSNHELRTSLKKHRSFLGMLNTKALQTSPTIHLVRDYLEKE